MEDTITTTDYTFVCPVCQNEVKIPEDCQIGDIVECEACGEEFEVVSINGEEITVMPIEEEK